jgi:hypothetical protein
MFVVLVIIVDIKKEELSDNPNTKKLECCCCSWQQYKSIKFNRIFEPMCKKHPIEVVLFLNNWIFQTLSSMKCLQEGFLIKCLEHISTVQRSQICLSGKIRGFLTKTCKQKSTRLNRTNPNLNYCIDVI